MVLSSTAESTALCCSMARHAATVAGHLFSALERRRPPARSSPTQGRGGRSLEAPPERLPSREQMWAGMGMETHNGGKLGPIAMFPTPDGAASPLI